MSDTTAYPAALPLGNPWHDSKSLVRAAHHETTRRRCRRRDRLHRQRRPDMKDDQELGTKYKLHQSARSLVARAVGAVHRPTTWDESYPRRHESLETLKHCFANKIILGHLPSYTSHKLQSRDVVMLAPLKVVYRDNAERLERGGVDTIGKLHSTLTL
jgi:hypothetical protein